MLAEIVVPFAKKAPDTLIYVYVSLSNVCNARCVYCDVHDNPAPREHFSQGDIARVLAEARKLGGTTVHFMGGGEPLISDNFMQSVLACTDLGMGVAVTTNGSHLKQRVAEMRDDTNLRLVMVSIDSHEPARHDAIRRIPGLWRHAIDGVAECRFRFGQARVVINHVLTTDNVGYLPAFLSWAGGIGAHAVNIIPVKDMPDFSVTAEQALMLAHGQEELRETAATAGVDLLFDPRDLTSWANEQGGGPPLHDYRCVFPRHAVYLDFPTGGIFPCDCTVHRKPEERFHLGNFWDSGLEAAWSGARIAALRQVLESPCDPGCKAQCDWNNRRSNRALMAAGPDTVA